MAFGSEGTQLVPLPADGTVVLKRRVIWRARVRDLWRGSGPYHFRATPRTVQMTRAPGDGRTDRWHLPGPWSAPFHPPWPPPAPEAPVARPIATKTMAASLPQNQGSVRLLWREGTVGSGFAKLPVQECEVQI